MRLILCFLLIRHCANGPLIFLTAFLNPNLTSETILCDFFPSSHSFSCKHLHLQAGKYIHNLLTLTWSACFKGTLTVISTVWKTCHLQVPSFPPHAQVWAPRVSPRFKQAILKSRGSFSNHKAIRSPLSVDTVNSFILTYTNGRANPTNTHATHLTTHSCMITPSSLS